MGDESNNCQTLEQLENDYWKAPEQFPTGMVKEIYSLRQKPLNEFDSNDIRLLISQNVGLDYLVPKAIDILKTDILEEALYFPGDLLMALLQVNDDYWIKNKKNKNILVSLVSDFNPSQYMEALTEEIIVDLNESLRKFLSNQG